MRLPDYIERDRNRLPFRLRVLGFIADYQSDHNGFSPSQKEIAAGVSISSAGSVWRALKILESEGRIERHRTQIRILREDAGRA